MGIDAFTPYYPSREKRANLVGLRRRPEFWLVEDDLTAWLARSSQLERTLRRSERRSLYDPATLHAAFELERPESTVEAAAASAAGR